MAAANPFRKALEAALVAQVQANGWNPETQIRWPNIPFDIRNVEEYVRFTYHEALGVPRTLGTTPRVEGGGSIELGIYTRGATGSDRADIIAGRQGNRVHAGSGLLAAYPYAGTLARDGFTVMIDTAGPGGDPVIIDGWWFKPVVINWTVWNAT